MNTGALRYRAIGLMVAPLVCVLGFVAPDGAACAEAARQAGPELVRLLQMVAALKLLLALGAAVLVDWRLRQPVEPGLAAAYCMGVALMAIGPGLIWSMAHIILGAGLLHAGLALLILLAWCDSGRMAAWRRRPTTKPLDTGAAFPLRSWHAR